MLVGGKGGEAPVNTVAPALSDSTPVYNQTISTTTGTWTSITTPTYAYQWQRNGGNIGGATSSSYTITSTDVGATVRCVVTATNPFGSTAANSNTSSTVAAIVPNAPTIGTATAGEEQATVPFTALSFPTQTGGATITNYQAISSPGSITATGAGTPITVTGLTGGTSYTFQVRAQNSAGYGSYSGNSNSVTPTAPPIGLFAAGRSSADVYRNVIQKITITTTGNATDFGDLYVKEYEMSSGAGSATRGIVAGGQTESLGKNIIQYSTFATSGNSTDFGDLTVARSLPASGNNSTRAVFMGGQPQYSTKQMDYVTIATTGNATFFGNLADNGDGLGRRYSKGTSSPTFSYYHGGNSGWDGQNYSNVQKVTTATTGNSSTFGSLASPYVTNYGAGASSGTRSVYAVGSSSDSLLGYSNVIYYFTNGSTGSCSDFGDLSSARSALGCCNSSVRGVWGGGRTSAAVYNNVMEYVTLDTTGNTTDFGDLDTAVNAISGMSSDNGGL